MDELTHKHYEKILKENDPMKRSPYDKNRPYKEGVIRILTSE
jgi:hypothetical protein